MVEFAVVGAPAYAGSVRVVRRNKEPAPGASNPTLVVRFKPVGSIVVDVAIPYDGSIPSE